MTASRVAVSVIIRVVVLVLFTIAFLAVVSTSDSTDALGIGLTYFMVVVVVACLWAAYDGLRRGLWPAGLVWLITSVVAALAITVVFVVQNDNAQGLAEELRDSTVFFGLLILLPAVGGALAGGLVHRIRAAVAD